MGKPTVCDTCGKECTGAYYEVEAEGDELTLGMAIQPKQFDKLGCISEYFQEFIGTEK